MSIKIDHTISCDYWLWSILIFSFLFNFIAIRIYFRAVYTSIISWLIEKCVCIFVDKIDNQLKILWLSTFIDQLNLSIDNYQQISSTIDLLTMFLMIDFDRHVTSWCICLDSPGCGERGKMGWKFLFAMPCSHELPLWLCSML